MIFILLFIVLFISESLYIKIANYFNIIDKPNIRSSHTQITIRGGGIIFWISSIFYFIFSQFSYPYFFIGLTLIACISFLDDIFTVSNKYRLLFQFICMSLMLWQLSFQLQPYWLFIIILIICVGVLNAYNFMDGINGMTGGYSLICLLSLLYINNYVIEFIDDKFIIFISLGILVFNFFNFRKKAMCFAGDIGSISIACIIIFLLLKLIQQSNQYTYILFLTVYGIDTIFTLILRILLKENIFQAHNKHLFQLLVNKSGFSHLQVSSIYGFVQLLINLFVVFLINHKQNKVYYPIALLIAFCYLYTHIRMFMIKTDNH